VVVPTGAGRLTRPRGCTETIEFRSGELEQHPSSGVPMQAIRGGSPETVTQRCGPRCPWLRQEKGSAIATAAPSSMAGPNGRALARRTRPAASRTRRQSAGGERGEARSGRAAAGAARPPRPAARRRRRAAGRQAAPPSARRAARSGRCTPQQQGTAGDRGQHGVTGQAHGGHPDTPPLLHPAGREPARPVGSPTPAQCPVGRGASGTPGPSSRSMMRRSPGQASSSTPRGTRRAA
jgi:hypothetical protein